METSHFSQWTLQPTVFTRYVQKDNQHFLNLSLKNVHFVTYTHVQVEKSEVTEKGETEAYHARWVDLLLTLSLSLEL